VCEYRHARPKRGRLKCLKTKLHCQCMVIIIF
jgi:hypothetical protein